MYILDNAGEVMFDELVLRRLEPELTIVTRSSPILNDVTVDEAMALGLDRYGRVIGTGSRFLGVDHARHDGVMGQGNDQIVETDRVTSHDRIDVRGHSACSTGDGSDTADEHPCSAGGAQSGRQCPQGIFEAPFTEIAFAWQASVPLPTGAARALDAGAWLVDQAGVRLR